MQVTANHVKNGFEPVHAEVETEPKTADRTETLAQRKTPFEQAYSAWIAEQNHRFEAHGLWCDDMDAVLSGI